MEIPAPEVDSHAAVERDSSSKVDRSHLPYFIAGATLTILLAMTIGTAFMVRTIVANQSDDRFESFSLRASNSVAAELRAVMSEVHDVSGVLVGSSHVTDVTIDTFVEFTSGLRAQGISAKTIGFIPLIQREDVDDFETSMRSQGFTAYIMEPNTGDSEQFPVAFMDPPNGIPAKFGDNLARDRVFSTAMNEARDTGRAAATAPFTNDGVTSFAMLAPIYQSGVRVQSTDQRRDALVGFGLTLYETESLMAGPITRADLSEVHITMTDLGPILAPVTAA